MTKITKTSLALAALGLSAWVITAQDAGTGPAQDQRPPRRMGPGGPAGPGGPRHRPPPPLIGALDANHDGVIDATEIANASAALLTLDKNGDGKLTIDELIPPPPPWGQGPDHPPGPPPGDGNGQDPGQPEK
jgi:EF hand